MKAIIIGAGRGRRLRPHTDDRPKCLVPVCGVPILDWILEALRGAGIAEIVFVGGYRIDDVRRHRPELCFVHNRDWASHNILLSLFCAEAHMQGGFVCCYADTVLDADLVRGALGSAFPLTLSVDTTWNARHGARPQAYDSLVEGVYLQEGRVRRIERLLPPGDAFGEFTGVAGFTAEGARLWREAFARARDTCATGPFGHAPSFEQAYLVDLVQVLVDQGVPVGCAPTEGGYIEIDTVEDYRLANEVWGPELQARRGGR